MQPRTKVTHNEKSLEILKTTIKNVSIPLRERRKNPRYATELPKVIGMKLTNKCNLRCKHCYQWNEDGYHKFMDQEEQNQDLDFEIVKKLLNETKRSESRLYLWGGEPLCYKNFDKICDLIAADLRETVICTNAILLEEHLDSIIKISEKLELLIPVEGFEQEHDEIRGKGNFQKVMKVIDRLLELKEKNIFKGKISIHTVINDNIIDKLYDLAEFYETKKIDFVLFCYPWYISSETSCKMDNYFREKFSWIDNTNNAGEKSWHAFKYNINADNIEKLKEQLQKINQKIWRISLRYQPDLEAEDINEFVLGNEVMSLKNRKCLSISTRMDVMPDGSVTACKFFSELQMGNLKNRSVSEIWHCEEFSRLREIIDNELMPVCSKCSVLHLHGHQ